MEQRTDYISVSDHIFYMPWELQPTIEYNDTSLKSVQYLFNNRSELTRIAQKNGMCLLLVHPEDVKRLMGQCVEDGITLMLCKSIEIYQNNQWHIKGFTTRCDPSGNLLIAYHEGKWEVGATSILSTIY